MKKIGTCCSR